MKSEERQLRLPFESLGSLEHGVNEVRRYHDDILDCDRVGKRYDMSMVHPTVVPEASTLQAIDHPNVVEVVGAVHVDGYTDPLMQVIEIITPFYPQGSITDALLRGDKFEPRSAIHITQAALRGLRELHVGHHLLHRDVKSGNILLDDPPVRAVVADIGMAGRLGAAGTAPSAENVNLYSAPELLSGTALTAASDIYGMGLVLRELLGGHFDYAAYSRDDVHDALATGRIPLTAADLALPVWAPTSVRRVYAKATAASPEKRYQSAKEMDDALARVDIARWRELDAGVYEATGYGPRAAAIRVEVTAVDSELSIAIKRWSASGWRRLPGGPDTTVVSLDSKQGQSAFDRANALALGR